MLTNRNELVQLLYKHATGTVVTSRNFTVTEYNKRKTRAATHLCIATLGDKRNQSGDLTRSRDNIHEVCLLALDDIGTKAKQPLLKPTYIVETSEGNYTYVYRYSHPIQREQADTIILSMIEAGYCDPGANGAERLFRLPDSQPEGKEMSRLIALDDVEYDPDTILEQFEVTEVIAHSSDYEPVSVTFPVHDEVADWLGVAHEGWQPIPCPWADEHTDHRTTAKYNAATQDDARRHFKCHHSHEHGTAEFLAWVAEQGGPSCGVEVRRHINDLHTGELEPHEEPQMRESGFATFGLHMNLDDLPDIKRTSKGAFAPVQKASPANVQWIADQCGLSGRLNMMTHDTEYEPDHPYLLIQQAAMHCGISGPAAEAIFRELPAEPYHPAEDWLNGLSWDGVDRFKDYAALWDADGPIELYLRKLFIQIVQAACGWRKPTQIPHVFVLCGGQGIGKTMWVDQLPFSATGVSLSLSGHNVRDSIVQATSTLVAELGEFETTYRKSEQGDLKMFLSRTHDTYRKPYGRDTETYPRSTVFIASVNTMDVLRDPTGSRRYWPVEVRTIPRNYDMTPLWAQAKALWDAGETHFLSEAEEKTRVEHSETHRAISEVEEALSNWTFFTPRNGVKSPDTAFGISMINLIKQCGLKTDDKTRSDIKLYIEQNGGRVGRHVCPYTKRAIKYGAMYLQDEKGTAFGPQLTLVEKD